MTEPRPRTGGRILVDALRVHGTDRLFCVPGESYLDVLDALLDVPSIDVVVAKHEGAAANMAEADGKLTGRPGICFVTRGPGATHASVGVHTAFQDSTPMILFIGQIERGFRDREGFQEVDYRAMFGPLAKWVAEIDDPARLPEYVLRAFQTATSGRPGPVVLALPEDVLSAKAAVLDTGPYRASQAAPCAEDIARIGLELDRAERPLMILGGGGWSADAVADTAVFAERFALPVATSFRRQDLFDNDHPSYAGHLTLATAPTLADHLRTADLLLVIGARLGEVPTGGYDLLRPPRLAQRFVHLHPDPDELSRVFQPDLAVVTGTAAAGRALRTLGPKSKVPWAARTRAMREAFERHASPAAVEPPRTGVDMAAVVSHLAATLPDDAIVTNGAGNFSVWIHRFHRYRRFRTQLAPTSGAMGYGLPAAVAAKVRHPERVVVCVAGDGDMLMYPQELATARQFGAAVVVLVVNNALYGTIRMHQARRFPGRVSATEIDGTDFVALAQAFGAHAERIDATADFAPALERALSAGRSALIELIVDPDQITPAMRLADRPE